VMKNAMTQLYVKYDRPWQFLKEHRLIATRLQEDTVRLNGSELNINKRAIRMDGVKPPAYCP